MAKKILSTLTLLSLLALFPAVVSAQEEPVTESAGPPQLVVPQDVYKFGTVMEGTKVQHDFEIRNVGNGPLEIKRVQPGCGCTVVELGKDALAPGEVASISATFDTTGFKGPKVRTIRLYTNDPKQPSTLLTFEGVVKSDVAIDPPRLYFGNVRKGEKVTQSVTVKVDGESGIAVQGVRARTEKIEVLSEDVLGSSGNKKVTVTLTDDIPVGVFKTRVAVKTNSKQNPVVNIPVFARVEGDLKLTPPDVSFGLLEGPLKEAASRTIRLDNSSEHKIKIVSVKSNNGAIKTSVKEVKAGKGYEIDVSVKTGTEGPLRGQIEVTTNHPDQDQRVLTLQVYGIISRKGA